MAARPHDEHASARFFLAREAQRFLWSATPFRDPESYDALNAFVRIASELNLPAPEVDWILLELLDLLGEFTYRVGPTLVERYLALRRPRLGGPLEFFRVVAQDALKCRSTRSPRVQRATSIIESEYVDPRLSINGLVQRLGGTRDVFVREFHDQVGLYASQYLRQVRLDHAALLLVTADIAIKEIWVAVGYSDASNFDHHFKDRFGISPREYRARGAQGVPVEVQSLRRMAVARTDPSTGSRKRILSNSCSRTILVVDDDLDARATLAQYLTLEGYKTQVAATAAEALQVAMSREPDAIVLDYHLDDCDGMESLVALRDRGFCGPVIIFSADFDVEALTDEFATLNATTLSKLCQLEDVAEAIESRLTG